MRRNPTDTTMSSAEVRALLGVDGDRKLSIRELEAFRRAGGFRDLTTARRYLRTVHRVECETVNDEDLADRLQTR